MPMLNNSVLSVGPYFPNSTSSDGERQEKTGPQRNQRCPVLLCLDPHAAVRIMRL
jgi:hypothetical protein